MAAIPLMDIGRGAVTMNPPWAYKLFTLRRINPKGVVPPQLRGHAGNTRGLSNAWRVMLARGAQSGGNAKTRARYRKQGKNPRPLKSLVGSGGSGYMSYGETF